MSEWSDSSKLELAGGQLSSLAALVTEAKSGAISLDGPEELDSFKKRSLQLELSRHGESSTASVRGVESGRSNPRRRSLDMGCAVPQHIAAKPAQNALEDDGEEYNTHDADVAPSAREQHNIEEDGSSSTGEVRDRVSFENGATVKTKTAKKSVMLQGMLLEAADKQAATATTRSRWSQPDGISGSVFSWRMLIPKMPILHPLSAMRLLWDLLITAASLYLACAAPLHYAAEILQPDGGHLTTLAPVTTVVYVCNVWFNIRTAVMHRGMIVSSSWAIARKYVRSVGCYIDLLVIVASLFMTHLPVLCILLPTAAFNVQRFLWKAELIATFLSPRALRVASISGIILVITHWSACGFILLAIKDGPPNTKLSWFSNYWIGTKGLDPIAVPTDLSTLYFWALYYAAETLSTVGWGDFVVTNEAEATYMTLMLACTTILQGLVVGGMSTMILASDAAWNHHKHKVDTIKAYMKHRKMPQETSRRVLNYLGYVWASNKGIDERDVLSGLPETLQEEVQISAHWQMISQVPLFEGCTERLLVRIIKQLKTREYLPGDKIIKAGEPGRDMLLISHGMVEVVQPPGHPPIFLSEGEYFGELGALVGGARTNDVIAYTHCLIYSLDHQTLVEIFVNNPRSIELLIDAMSKYINFDELSDYVRTLYDDSPPPKS